MSEENKPEDLEKNIQDMAKKLNVDIDLLREISPEEIQYLLDHCPFLQIVGPTVELKETEVKIVQSESGWDIHDYGDALSSSPGRLLFGGGDFRLYLDEDEEGGSGGAIINPGKGTIRNQAFVTASEMVMMAQEHGWGSIAIRDGHPLMKRAAWIKAGELNMGVEGFEPTGDDKRVRERVTQSSDEFKTLKESIKPKAK